MMQRAVKGMQPPPYSRELLRTPTPPTRTAARHTGEEEEEAEAGKEPAPAWG